MKNDTHISGYNNLFSSLNVLRYIGTVLLAHPLLDREEVHIDISQRYLRGREHNEHNYN